MASHDPPIRVNAFELPLIEALLQQAPAYNTDAIEDVNEMETSLMFKLIKEKLDQINSSGNEVQSISEGKEYSSKLGGGLPLSKAYDPTEESTRDRIYSGITVVTDDDIANLMSCGGMAAHPPGYECAFEDPPMYAWHCQYCPEGVGWTEDEPCTVCGLYLDQQPGGSSSFYASYYNTGSDDCDWICSMCANHNWNWRMQCNRCHTCRQDEAAAVKPSNTCQPSSLLPSTGLPALFSVSPRARVGTIVKHRLKKRLSTHPAGVFKDHDWVCTSCGNINWDWRMQCHQCRCAKPVVCERGMASYTQ